MELTSPRVLKSFMEYRGLSVRVLAKEADVSSAVVGHLACGLRKTCRPATAGRIERALAAPPGVVFRARVSIRDTTQTAARNVSGVSTHS